jgi:hypothetical protein
MGEMRGLWVLACVCAVVASGCPEDGEPGDDTRGEEDGGAAGSAEAGRGGRSGRGGTGGNGGRSGASGSDSSSGGRNASGSGGRDASGSGGRDASGSGGRDAAGSGDEECPPTCFRAFTCAASCDDEPVNNGCCPCPPGTIDTITCSQTEGRCTIPCSGVAPDEQVQADCQAITAQAECEAYEASEFPFQCVWETGRPEPCLAP